MRLVAAPIRRNDIWIRSHDNKGLTTVPVLSRVLREPHIHDRIAGNRRLCRLLLSREYFLYNLPVRAHRCQLEDRRQTCVPERRSRSNDRLRLQCLDRFRDPDHADASAVQAAETAEAKAADHGPVLLRRLVSGEVQNLIWIFPSCFLTTGIRVSFASLYRCILTHELSLSDPSCKLLPKPFRTPPCSTESKLNLAYHKRVRRRPRNLDRGRTLHRNPKRLPPNHAPSL